MALVFNDERHYAEAEWIAARHQTYDENNGEPGNRRYGILNLKYVPTDSVSPDAGINNFFDRTYAVTNTIGLTTISEGAQPSS